MKSLSLLLLLMATGSLLTLRAQTMETPSDAPSGMQPAAALPRNIMPLGINHKPNPVAPPSAIAVPIAKFFNGLKSGDYANTYETFLAGSKLGQQKEKMSVFISKTQEALGLYGGLYDYEIFDNYSIGTNVMVLTYLSRHDSSPLRWRFIYYRPKTDWVLLNMGFDDVLLDMLD
jgi:hypothetical protein